MQLRRPLGEQPTHPVIGTLWCVVVPLTGAALTLTAVAATPVADRPPVGRVPAARNATRAARPWMPGKALADHRPSAS